MDQTETSLPGVLAEIEEVAGRQAALDLALALGGETLHIPAPAHVTGNHALAVAVGVRSARKIAERFRGDSLYVPMARRALVRELSGRGLAPAEIAARLGINKHTVRQYRRGGYREHAPLNFQGRSS